MNFNLLYSETLLLIQFSLDNVCRQLMHIYLEGTTVTEKAVLDIICCQQNLEHLESEFLTSALTKIVNDNNFMENASLQAGQELTQQLSEIQDSEYARKNNR